MEKKRAHMVPIYRILDEFWFIGVRHSHTRDQSHFATYPSVLIASGVVF
jgi:hypothetical protein